MSNVLLPIFTNHRQMKISRSVTFNGRKAFRWWNLRFSFDTPSHSENTPWFCGKFSRDCFDSHKLWLVMNSNEWKSNHQIVSWCGHKSLYSKLKYLNQWSCHWIVGPVVLCDFILLGWAHFSVCIFLLDSLNRTHCVYVSRWTSVNVCVWCARTCFSMIVLFNERTREFSHNVKIRESMRNVNITYTFRWHIPTHALRAHGDHFFLVLKMLVRRLVCFMHLIWLELYRYRTFVISVPNGENKSVLI